MKTMIDLEEVMDKACLSNTVVVVGDIRRSQDLMTYARDEHDFSKRMVEFITATRRALDEHGGFFDKFTGDGFVGYFNESICRSRSGDYLEQFANFVRGFTGFCNGHFREWVKHVRKIPDQPVGLAIGADLGQVSFQSLNYHLVAVSETIVWASRMASTANAEEVMVNNFLYQALRERGDLKFERRSGKTKAGESFQAWRMEAGNV
jgi:class 3 adenylate cyclase